jgi:hypothetical protein
MDDLQRCGVGRLSWGQGGKIACPIAEECWMDIDDFLFDAEEGAGGWIAVVRRKDGRLINLDGLPGMPSLTKPNFATQQDAIKAAQDMVAAALKAGWQP